MPLIDLKTNLKSLKYGFDRPNMGSSKEPFITKPIPDERLIDIPDFILRDGALRKGVEDISRLTQLFTTVRGLRFIANTNLLAAQNPKIPGAPRNLYLPTNTLAQVGINAIGGHLNLLGEVPIDIPSTNINLGNISFDIGGEKYDTLYKNSYSQTDSNRLVLLQKSKVGSAFLFSPPPAPKNVGEAIKFGTKNIIKNLTPELTIGEISKAKDYGVAVIDNDLILNYTGGPGAGITGLKTKIKRDSYTIGSEKYVNPVPIENGQDPKNVKTYQVGRKIITYGDDIKGGEINANRYLGASVEFGKDATTGITEKGDPSEIKFGVKYESSNTRNQGENTRYPTYTNSNNTQTFKSNPNFTIRKYGDLSSTGDYGDDKFNKNITAELQKAIFNNNGYANVSEEAPDNQLFKFYLNLIEADAPGKNKYLYWQAYVDSFTDNISVNHNEYNYVGRGYSLYKYDKFNRDINLSFTIVTPNPDQTLVIYKRLNRLIRSLAPNYSQGGYLRGNFVRLTFGDYLNNVPGILRGFTLTPIFDAGFSLESGLQLPIAIKVDGFNFTPIASNDNRIIDISSDFISLPDDPTQTPQQAPSPQSSTPPTADFIQSGL